MKQLYVELSIPEAFGYICAYRDYLREKATATSKWTLCEADNHDKRVHLIRQLLM